MITRSFAVDAVRSLALAEGKTAFGDKTMMQSRLGLWLAASRFHRALYGVTKVCLINNVNGTDTVITPLKYDFPQQTGYDKLDKSDPHRTNLQTARPLEQQPTRYLGSISIVAPSSLPQNKAGGQYTL